MTKCKAYVTLERLYIFFNDKGVIDTSIHKSKYQIFPEILKSSLGGTVLKNVQQDNL